MNNDYNYDNYQGSNEVYPSYTEVNTFRTNNIDIKPPKKRRKWPIVLLILLLLIVGVLIYLTFFTDKLDFIKPDDNYSEFDPNKGKIESNSNIVSNSNKTSNSNKKSNSNSNIISNVNKDVTSVAITPTTPSVVVGSTVTLKTNITPNDAKDKSITWKSSDTKIATVNNKGIVTGVKVGTTTITATSKNGKKASVKLTVTAKKIPVTGLTLNSYSGQIYEGRTYNLSAYVLVMPSDATNKEVTYKSSNTSVATISKTGLITGISPGVATITVTTNDGNISRLYTVNVLESDVQSVYFSLPNTIYVGNSSSASVSYNPTTAINGKRVTWKSSNTSIATVSSLGMVKGIKEGDVKITATTTNGKSYTRNVAIRENPVNYYWTIEILTMNGHSTCYRRVYKNKSPYYDYKSITYNGTVYYPQSSDGVNDQYISCDKINQSIKNVSLTTNAGYKITIPIEYSIYNY